jgi:hypothetical protein
VSLDRHEHALVTDRQLAGAAIGGLATLTLAAALVPLRDHVVNANLALALVLPVLVAALSGGRLAGVVTAIVAAASFDFFFTRPYTRLTIASRDDIETMVMLSIVALVVAEIGAQARRLRHQTAASHSDISRVHRIAELAARGTPSADLLAAVEAELIGLFDLEDCTFETRPTPISAELPRLGARGAFEGQRVLRFEQGEFTLPIGGVALPVVGAGHEIGRLVLLARPATRASVDQRLVAVVLADELGIALASAAG